MFCYRGGNISSTSIKEGSDMDKLIKDPNFRRVLQIG